MTKLGTNTTASHLTSFWDHRKGPHGEGATQSSLAASASCGSKCTSSESRLSKCHKYSRRHAVISSIHRDPNVQAAVGPADGGGCDIWLSRQMRTLSEQNPCQLRWFALVRVLCCAVLCCGVPSCAVACRVYCSGQWAAGLLLYTATLQWAVGSGVLAILCHWGMVLLLLTAWGQ